MGVFDNCEQYRDYLEVIRTAIFEEELPVLESNSQSFDYLCGIDDDKVQKKSIATFKIIDHEFGNNGTHKLNMRMRLNPILAIGTLFKMFSENIKDLNAQELSMLAIGEYSTMDELSIKMIRIFTNSDLLGTISSKYEQTKQTDPFALSNIFFMIKEHYKKRVIDNNDDNELNQFIREMIDRINNDTLHNGVESYLEHLKNNGDIEQLRRAI